MTFNELLPPGWAFERADFSDVVEKGFVLIKNAELDLGIYGYAYSFDEAVIAALIQIPYDKFSAIPVKEYVSNYLNGVKLEDVLPKGWGFYRAFTSININKNVSEIVAELHLLEKIPSKKWVTSTMFYKVLEIGIADTLDEALFRAIKEVENVNI